MSRRTGLLVSIWLGAIILGTGGALLWVRGASARPAPKTLAEVANAPRVKKARARIGETVKKLFGDAGVAYPPPALYVRVLKLDDVLELWGGERGAPLKLVKSYPVCARSGLPGPKRKEGDYQVPEGFYTVDRLNPWSSYHLSLGIDYPNRSDRIRGDPKRPGGAIFIHGDCVTIGCVPIEDEPMEEVFLAALDARMAGLPSVPVHIFPGRLDLAGMLALKAKYGDRKPEIVAFWESELRPAYLAFEETRRVPKVTIDKKSGAYRVEPAPVADR